MGQAPTAPRGSSLATIQGTIQSPTKFENAATGPTGTATSTRPEARLDVVYANEKLTVNAANASLNQLLRDITQKTGLTISGGVSEERVFGHYGPLPVAEVLIALLDGTGSNVVLVENKSGHSELILTPRRGGVTPPSANSSMAQNNAQEPQEPQEQYVPPVQPFRPPVAMGRGPVGANPDGSPALTPPPQDETNTAPPVDSAEPKTPQEIYEQLQAIEAQKPPAPEE